MNDLMIWAKNVITHNEILESMPPKWMMFISYPLNLKNERQLRIELKVDITKQVKTPYIVTASRLLSKIEFLHFVDSCRRTKSIESFNDMKHYESFIEDIENKHSFPTINFIGFELPEHLKYGKFGLPFDDSYPEWKVSNKGKLSIIQDYYGKHQRWLGNNFDYVSNFHSGVIFTNVPLLMFKRYWNKPVKLNNYLRHGNKIYKMQNTVSSILMKTSQWSYIEKYGIFDINYQFQESITRIDPKMVSYRKNEEIFNWMSKYIKKGIYLFTDKMSIFKDPEEEFLFTIEILNK
jgi:hypothetical protein